MYGNETLKWNNETTWSIEMKTRNEWNYDEIMKWNEMTEMKWNGMTFWLHHTVCDISLPSRISCFIPKTLLTNMPLWIVSLEIEQGIRPSGRTTEPFAATRRFKTLLNTPFGYFILQLTWSKQGKSPRARMWATNRTLKVSCDKDAEQLAWGNALYGIKFWRWW